MELISEQIRLLMMHKWLLGSNATVTSERISLAWSKDTVGKSLLPEKWQEGLEGEGEYLDY
ncbi:hypothetical protein KIN20_007545 [Parelaphostrongylus tenuis]|uniref:Uncharacterized protein n=1 Tax=Parelaphostrongylus tenuis TaxID=148309 RepID=A0AAD5QM43_PARTN|nr:hypothetical protein KIN20_007545 [Parelaphostrongylus tenuis]